MNPLEAAHMVENIKKDIAAGKATDAHLVAAANTIALESPRWFLEMAAAMNKKRVVAPAEATTSAGAVAPVGAGGPRMGADGQPMDDKQASLEAMMEAAAGPAGSEASFAMPNLNGPPQQAAPQPVVAPPAPTAPQPAPAPQVPPRVVTRPTVVKNGGGDAPKVA